MDYTTCGALQPVRILTPFQRHYLETFYQHQLSGLQAKDDQTIVLGVAVLFGLFIGSAASLGRGEPGVNGTTKALYISSLSLLLLLLIAVSSTKILIWFATLEEQQEDCQIKTLSLRSQISLGKLQRVYSHLSEAEISSLYYNALSERTQADLDLDICRHIMHTLRLHRTINGAAAVFRLLLAVALCLMLASVIVFVFRT